MDKKQFLEKVSALFIKHGPKTFTMDDIAKEFSISKKTLYQFFPNKEEILKEVMHYILDTVIDEVDKKNAKCVNPIQAFIGSDENIENLFVNIRDNFILQMIKYYPEIYKAHVVHVYERLHEIFEKNISKGRALGFFRKDFDSALYAKFFLQICYSADESPLFVEEMKDRISFRKNVSEFYLNSILTDKGKLNLKELIENDKEN